MMNCRNWKQSNRNNNFRNYNFQNNKNYRNNNNYGNNNYNNDFRNRNFRTDNNSRNMDQAIDNLYQMTPQQYNLSGAHPQTTQGANAPPHGAEGGAP